MSTYIRKPVHLSENQMKKIATAAKNNSSIVVRIDPNAKPNTHFYLTNTQIKKLSDKQPHDINLSKTQLQKNGGFVISLPLLLGGISAAAAAAGAASNVARAVNQKKHETKMRQLQNVQNQKLENLMKKGKGAFLPKKYQ